MTATATVQTATTDEVDVLTDLKGVELNVRYFVKAKGLDKAEVTRLERKSKRVVLRTEDGKVFARRASTVQVLKSHGRIMKAKAPKVAKKV